MFRWFRDLFRAYIGALVAFQILILFVVLPALAVWTLVSLLHAGRLDDAATALILISVAGAVMSFILWVRYDINEASRRREQRAEKKAALSRQPADATGENEIDDAADDEPPSEQFRPSSRQ